MKNYKQLKRKYLIDFEIIRALNITIDQKKIKSICKHLDIDMSNCKSKISKRNNLAIAIIGNGNNHYIQYEVKHNLNIDELNEIENNILPNEMKSIIMEAYNLSQVKTLRI